jgi:hypothetical protein
MIVSNSFSAAEIADGSGSLDIFSLHLCIARSCSSCQHIVAQPYATHSSVFNLWETNQINKYKVWKNNKRESRDDSGIPKTK